MMTATCLLSSDAAQEVWMDKETRSLPVESATVLRSALNSDRRASEKGARVRVRFMCLAKVQGPTQPQTPRRDDYVSSLTP